MAWGTCTFNQGGGSGGETRTLYFNYATSSSKYKISYWATQQSTSTSYRITTCGVPTKTNKAFAGYYSDADQMIVNASGNFVNFISYTLTLLPTSVTAHWRDYATVTLTLNGGTGGTTKFYRRLDDGRCYSDTALTNELTSIVVPTKYGAKFDGATYNGTTVIDKYGRFTGAFRAMSISAGSFSVSAVWNTNYSTVGDVYDWFGLASANLVPIASDAGDNKKRTCVSNATLNGSTQSDAGRYTSGVDHVSGVWRNPSVTYKVIGDCTVSLNLGKAFAATVSGSSMTVSGFMITAVEVRTRIGEFPTVTVEAVASEGVNAINLFAVSIPIEAKAHAQNLLSAFSGSCVIQSFSMRASAEPVVLAENNMPCASDVVHGRYVASAEMLARLCSHVPSAANGFTSLGEPKKGRESEFVTYSVAAQKEIV